MCIGAFDEDSLNNGRKTKKPRSVVHLQTSAKKYKETMVSLGSYSLPGLNGFFVPDGGPENMSLAAAWYYVITGKRSNLIGFLLI